MNKGDICPECGNILSFMGRCYSCDDYYTEMKEYEILKQIQDKDTNKEEKGG